MPKHINIPSVPPQIIAWVHKRAHQNYWKVQGLCDRDDLIQEGYYSIAYCLNRYGTNLKPPHLMRLVQLTFNCAIIDLAKKRTRLSERHVASTEDGQQDYAGMLGHDSQSDLDRLVAEAPESVRRALVFLMNDAGKMRESYPVTSDGRETTSNRICSSIGIDKDSHLMDKVRLYLKGR